MYIHGGYRKNKTGVPLFGQLGTNCAASIAESM